MKTAQALFGAALLASTSHAQLVPGTVISEESSWNQYDGPDENIRFEFTTEMVVDGALDMSFTIFSHRESGNPMIRGLALVMVDPQLFCQTEEDTDCLPEDTFNDDDYPANQFYLAQASRKVTLTLYNPTTNSGTDGTDCRMRLLDNYCDSVSSCDALGWTQEDGCGPTTTANQDTDIVLGRTGLVQSFERAVESNVGGARVYSLRVTLRIQEDLFETGSAEDDRFNFQLDTGKKIYFTWAVWTDDATSTCSSTRHDNLFATKHSAAGTAKLNPQVMHYFKHTAPPTESPTASPTTESPTESPTDSPTQAPSLSPTGSPTTSPTTPVPTEFPTGSPTQFPTESPTTPRPTVSPSSAPTGRPSPPTSAPTPFPTRAPIELACPEERGWEFCERINTMWEYLRGVDDERRTRKIQSKCEAHGCHYCGYADSQTNCRAKVNEDGNEYAADFMCPDDESDPFEPSDEQECKMFPNCPTPLNIRACRSINSGPGYKRALCEGGFEFEDQRIPAKACGYHLGVCRALGEYWWGRKTIYNIPGLFDVMRECPANELIG